MDARIKSGHDEWACVQTKHNFKQRVSQSQFRGLAARFARVLVSSSRPLQSEGAGNAGRPMRPIAACAMIVVERTRVSQVTPESPGIPRAMVYGLYRALPGDRLFCHRRRRNCFRQLDASVGASGPHVFAVRRPVPSSLAPLASTASRPAAVTIASRPSLWDGTAEDIK